MDKQEKMMMKESTGIRLLLLAFILMVLFLTTPANALQVTPGPGSGEPHRVPTVSTRIKLDGILDEAAWQKALVLELKYEVEPGENIEAPVKTQLLLVSGGSQLYAAFRAYDPDPSQIRARLTDRDNIFNDDYVGIFLDTYNDSRKAFGFLVNPYGIQADQYALSTKHHYYEWDAIWGSAGKITKEGYMVEMAIPFNSMRFQGKKEDQVWGIDAVRIYPRNLDHVIGLFPRDRSDNCYMCQAEKVIGFGGARPGKNIELDPTLSGHLTQERDPFPEGKMEKKNSQVAPGITARWNFTTNLTLSATANPDFSQVEADAAQLDINTPVALFYPEKRPFFLEDSNLFLTNFYMVHTRTIKDPDWGIKLSGKEGKNAIGFFTVQDSVTQLIFPSKYNTIPYTLDQSNISTVLRCRRDVGSASTVGILITDREGEDYFNRAVGLDGDLRLTKKDRLQFQFLGSQSKYPDRIVQDFNQPQGEFRGNGGFIYYQHKTRNFKIYGQYGFASDNLRTDVGFNELSNVKTGVGGASYTWWRNPGYWFTNLTVDGSFTYIKDYQGNFLEKTARGDISYSGPLQSYIDIIVTMGKRTYLDEEFDVNNLEITAQFRPGSDLFMALTGGFGDCIDYANLQQGNRVFLDPAIQYNIGRHLYVELDHVFERLNVDAGRLYTANLSNFRVVYQFNNRTFLRTILQYADFNYNAETYTFPIDPRFKHLFSQILFSYKINPQTVLFLGYSDDYYGYRLIPIKQNNRTFFLKIGYALVL
jgi:hypothetical protein